MVFIKKKCLYCLNDKDKKEFSHEHVIPRQLGKFNFPTIRICKECNEKFSHDFENDIALQSNIRNITNCILDNNTLIATITEFESNKNSQRFLFKIIFNFLYLILPQELFYNLNISKSNSINLLRNIIYDRITFADDNITVNMADTVDVKDYRDEYTIVLSNDAYDEENNKYIKLQLTICNYFTIQFPVRIKTSSDSFAYIFTFDKKTRNVSILDFEKGSLGNWNSGIQKKIQDELNLRLEQ